MSDENVVILTGRLGETPRFRTTPSGDEVCDISVASNRYSKPGPDGKRNQQTTWVKVTTWKQQAIWVNENCDAGDMVLVRGMLVDDNYEDKNTGQMTRRLLKIDNARVQLTSKRTTVENNNVGEIPEV